MIAVLIVLAAAWLAVIPWFARLALDASARVPFPVGRAKRVSAIVLCCVFWPIVLVVGYRS